MFFFKWKEHIKKKSRYYHQEWAATSETTSSKLEKKLKETKKIIFFHGAIFKITFNKEVTFSNSQNALLLNLPLQEDLSSWSKIKILKSSIGLRNIELDPNTPKETYLSQGSVEVEIGIALERTLFIGNSTQVERNKYGIKHHVTSTIHAAMGDTLQSMASEISRNNGN